MRVIWRGLGSSEFEVPVIGLGTWEMEREERGEVVRALQAGIDAGATHVDTAEMYGNGEVERIVGEAIRGRRAEVFVASKVLPSNASSRGTIAACECSLARLGTDHLDLYLLHWPGSHPLADTLAAFETLRETGKIRAYGVSNFDADELDEAVAIAGAERIACNQVLYHLAERAIEHALIPRCEEHGVTVVAYSPFAQGAFPGLSSRGGRVLAELAAARGATPRQLALAFLTRRSSVVAIPKAGRAAHARENAAAGDLRIDDEEIRRIDAAFPRGPARRGVPML